MQYSDRDVLDLGVCSGSLSVAVLNTKSNFREERVYLSPCFQAMVYHQGKPGEEAVQSEHRCSNKRKLISRPRIAKDFRVESEVICVASKGKLRDALRNN